MKRIKVLFLMCVLCVFSIASTCSATGYVPSAVNPGTQIKNVTYTDANGNEITIDFSDGSLTVVDKSGELDSVIADLGTSKSNPVDFLEKVGMLNEIKNRFGLSDDELAQYTFAVFFGIDITGDLLKQLQGSMLTMTVSQDGITADSDVVVLQMFEDGTWKVLDASAGNGEVTFTATAVANSKILFLTKSAVPTPSTDSTDDTTGTEETVPPTTAPSADEEQIKRVTYTDANGNVITIDFSGGSLTVVDKSGELDSVIADLGASKSPVDFLEKVGMLNEVKNRFGLSDDELAQYTFAAFFGVDIRGDLLKQLQGSMLTLTVNQDGITADSDVVVLQMFEDGTWKVLDASAGNGEVTFTMTAVANSRILFLTKSAAPAPSTDSTDDTTGTDNTTGTEETVPTTAAPSTTPSTEGGNNSGAETGDVMNVVVWTSIMAVAVMAAGLVVLKKRQR